MKNLLVHGVYLTIITIGAIVHNSSVEKNNQTVQELEVTSINSNKLLKEDADRMIEEIRINVNAQPKYSTFLNYALSVTQTSNKVYKLIDNIKNNALKYENSALRDSINQLYKTIISNIDTKERNIYNPQSMLFRIINQTSYWKLIESASGALLNNLLSDLQAKIMNDQILFLNYFCLKSSRYVSVIEHWYRVAIAPQKAALIQGDTFRVECFILESLKFPALRINVNGEELNVENGLGHYEVIANKLGNNLVRATATVKEPFTGDSITIRSELQYEVLPKCSRDCLQKQ